MIKVSDITKWFGKEQVLKGVSTSFSSQQISFIIGRSGAGKTVFLQCLLGLEKKTTGEIWFDDQACDFTQNTKQIQELRNNIGVVFQYSALFDWLTVGENIRFPMDSLVNIPMSEKKDRVESVLDRVGLLPAIHKMPSEISGGMKKRVAIARAIVMQPKYLFCDEPNSGLDPQTSVNIDRLIKEITQEQGITTIVNSHDINSVISIGDHIMFMDDGLKNWEGTPNDLLQSNLTPALEQFMVSSEIVKRYRNQ